MVWSRFLHFTVRSALLLGFAFYIRHLVSRGQLLQYLEPEMAVYVSWSAVGLLIMALHQAYLALDAVRNRHQPAACSCEGEDLPPFRMKSLLIYALYALPLIIGFAAQLP